MVEEVDNRSRNSLGLKKGLVLVEPRGHRMAVKSLSHTVLSTTLRPPPPLSNDWGVKLPRPNTQSGDKPPREPLCPMVRRVLHPSDPVKKTTRSGNYISLIENTLMAFGG